MTSVVIPTYNRAGLLIEAIDSVLAQSEDRFEVLVVDDGSTDDTEARVRRLRDPRISYLRIAHQGVAAARNIGIELARGRYISFLDSDDLWKPGKLATELAFLRRHPEVGIVFSDLEKWDGGRFVPSFMRTTEVFSKWLIGPRGKQSLLLPPSTMRWCLLQEVPIKVPSLTIRRELLRAAGGFNATWSSSEDWELLLRLAPTTMFGYIDEPLAIIRLSPDSLHRLDQERGDSSMIELLAREREASTDAATRAAARRGLCIRTKHLSWHYVDSGRLLAGSAACLRGFLKTGDPMLLARALRLLVAQRGASESAP
jgi:glycosyltransferase involved in cell wall biosynthesis